MMTMTTLYRLYCTCCVVAADIYTRDYAGRQPRDIVKAGVSQDTKGLDVSFVVLLAFEFM